VRTVTFQRLFERGKIFFLKSEQWKQERMEQTQPGLLFPLLLAGRLAGERTQWRRSEEGFGHLK
jgi:hypothetical protein